MDGRDHPVGRHAAGDGERAVSTGLDVLADDRGQHITRLGHPVGELAALQHAQRGIGITDQRIHQRLARLGVSPITRRLARRLIVILAVQHRPHCALQPAVARSQQPADRATHQRDGVLGGHRVEQRRRVQRALESDQARLRRDLLGDPPDPLGIPRRPQAGAQVHQHRVRTAGGRLLPVAHPGRMPPARIEGEPLSRLPVRQTAAFATP
jgi:hypothetical protein